MKTKKHYDEYSQLKNKMLFRLILSIIMAIMVLFLIYSLWSGRGSEIIVYILTLVFRISYTNAVDIYTYLIRNNAFIIVLFSITLLSAIFLRFTFSSFTRHFDIVNQGIDSLLKDDNAEIHLSHEMLPIERKLNTVKRTLKQRSLEVQQAEQRKNDLVTYLAHDIRTPLTSIIGYLNLLDESCDIPVEQRQKYIGIALDKSNRLEKMINEFFEITRYNLQYISLEKENIDLSYMLIQILDEISPSLAKKGNNLKLDLHESLRIVADPDKLARVFNNILKNAIAYSYQDSDITIRTAEDNNSYIVSFENKGPPVSKENLAVLFEKFYRLDEARSSDTGGTGLGLAIAKEIIDLHGGTIIVKSENSIFTVEVFLPRSGNS